MFGVNEFGIKNILKIQGNSVLVHMRGFNSYFYVLAPREIDFTN